MHHTQKIAIVYDWIDSWGGVERVLLNFHALFPHAEFYTSYYDIKRAPWAKPLNIRPSFIQRLPDFIKRNRIISLPLYPFAFESFELSSYDLVISVSSAFAKSVITKPQTRHLCYLLTPPRYLWGMTDVYANNAIAAPLLRALRQYDYLAAARPDRILSISQAVSERCNKYYRRTSEVLHPPFDVAYWKEIKGTLKSSERPMEQSYHLIVSRLEAYKSVDLPILLFNKNRQNLVIIGKGTKKTELMQLAGPTVTFVQDITDKELARWYTHAEALIMPQEEDFGYVALEAQLFGCPVVSYTKGGAHETVYKDMGVFFASQTEKSLQEALERLRHSSYNGKVALQEVDSFLDTFSKDQFEKRLQKYISDIL